MKSCYALHLVDSVSCLYVIVRVGKLTYINPCFVNTVYLLTTRVECAVAIVIYSKGILVSVFIYQDSYSCLL